jgi:hypothetical protein
MVSPSRERDQAVLLFRRKDLLNEFDGWGTVQAELHRRRNDINVAPQLRSMAHALHRINATVLAISAKGARPHARFLRGLMELVRDNDTRRVPIVFTMQRGTGERKRIKLRHFPIAQMRQLLPSDTYLQALA